MTKIERAWRKLCAELNLEVLQVDYNGHFRVLLRLPDGRKRMTTFAGSPKSLDHMIDNSRRQLRRLISGDTHVAPR